MKNEFEMISETNSPIKKYLIVSKTFFIEETFLILTDRLVIK